VVDLLLMDEFYLIRVPLFY